MGFLDAPDEQLRDDERVRAEQVVSIVAKAPYDLSHHHRREVEYVLLTAWLSARIEVAGPEVLGNVTMMQWANLQDQARRIGSHFTRDQGGTFDFSVRAVKADPEAYGATQTG